MPRKRFIVEIGTGIDIHGEDVTEAACRAVKDAVSRSCLCGLVEILELQDTDQIEVEVVVASLEEERAQLEADRNTVRVPAGAPPSETPSLEGLSAREKIAAGVASASK